ncbi:hypothetical protein ACIA49_33245 [Kribbella sp. NPDC051587]|uniref:hypothetical protein n=1 Tax=Kribbella sp. NPDC051587 TaxID=3364119 RepID=UPI00378FCFD2
MIEKTDLMVDVHLSLFFVVAGTGGVPEPKYSDAFLEVRGSGLICFSAAPEHTAKVRLEWWQGRPPPCPEPWEAQRIVELERGDGPAAIVPLADGVSSTFPLGDAPGRRLRAHVLCRGRKKIRQLNGAVPSVGTEVWLIQLWFP